MQSHASRHAVSEFLQDLHPDLSPDFPREIVKDEIAEAYGRRAVPKLIGVLSLPGLSDGQRAHALRVLNGLLSTQEHKTNAIHEGAARALTALLSESLDTEVRRLACQALASLAEVMAGRQAITEVQGLQALTHALQTTPEAAAGALREFSRSLDGTALLLSGGVVSEVVPALVHLCSAPQEQQGQEEEEEEEGSGIRACENVAATLAAITRTDEGTMAALRAHVPKCMVALAQRGLEGDLKFEPDLMALLEQVALCLQQLCHHAYGKTAAREAEAYKVLSEMLTLQHKETVRHASSALMALAVEKEAKVAVMLFAGMNLVRLLRGNDPVLAANARDALAAASEHLEARRTVEMLLSFDERKELLWRGATPAAPPDYRYHVESAASLAASAAAAVGKRY